MASSAVEPIFTKPSIVLLGNLTSVLTGPFVKLFFRLLIPILFSYYMYDWSFEMVLTFFEEDIDTKYFDFIIVGAGSSGCVLAHYLSENFSVLLLEAGGQLNPLVYVPSEAYPNLSRFPLIYKNEIVPQRSSSFSSVGNVTSWPSGKGLGGSSKINGLIYIRGNNLQYDAIANRTGDSRWKLKNVLQHFKDIENYDGRFNKRDHGQGGGMNIEGGYQSKFIKNYLKAGEELGYIIRDPNADGPLTEGFAPMDFYMKDGRRWDAYKGFIDPILDRINLTVVKYAFVKKVLLKGVSAFGVQYDHFGSEKVAYCNKEVILSAGALSTPKILMLSGIGPDKHLEDIGIPVKVNVPKLGANLQDKYGALLPFRVKKHTSFKIQRDTTIQNMLQWFTIGSGPLATSRTEATFSISSTTAKNEGTENDPDIHTYCLTFTPDKDVTFIFKGYNFNEKFISYFTNISKKYDGFVQLVTISRPEGTGFLRLRDKDPYSLPIINPQYLENERDIRVLTEALQIAVKLVDETKNFAEIDGKYFETHFPGCEKHEFKSYNYFGCVARRATMTAFKYGGTVPVGSVHEKDTCVDSSFRVLGAKRLRVIDGSVLQEKHVSVNDASCRMLGKMGAEIIKEYWKQ